MERIPEDVLAAVNECIRDMFVDPLKPMVPFVAHAILAERKRCAEVARGEAHADCDVAEQIAKLIEAGT